MVRVFLDAGYQVRRTFESGLVHSRSASSRPSSRWRSRSARAAAEARSIERLLRPRSVAVIGASNDPHKIGNVVFRNLMGFAPRGPVYPINPEARSVPGCARTRACWRCRTTSTWPWSPCPRRRCAGGRAVRGQAGTRAGGGLQRVRRHGTRTGATAQHELVAHARRTGCGGRAELPGRAEHRSRGAAERHARPAAEHPRGRVGFFCQSGALGVAIWPRRGGAGSADHVRQRRQPRRRVRQRPAAVLGGRRGHRGRTAVPGELRQPRKFARLAQRLARSKPVVAVRSGRHAAGLRPRCRPTRTRCRRSGCRRCSPGTACSRWRPCRAVRRGPVAGYQPLPRPAGSAWSPTPPRSAPWWPTRARVPGCRRAAAGHRRGGERRGARYGAARGACRPADRGARGGVRAALATSGEEVAAVLAGQTAGWDRPVVSTFLAMDGVPAQLRRPGPDGGAARGSVPSYTSPERAVLALAHAVTYAEWRRERPQDARPGRHRPRRGRAGRTGCARRRPRGP